MGIVYRFKRRIMRSRKLKKRKLRLINEILRRSSDMVVYYSLMLRFKFIKSDCEPIRCCHCGSKKGYTQKAVDFIENTMCEAKALCLNCGKDIGYWSYGSWTL